MSNFERGVYQPPSDDVRVFDGSEDEEDMEGSRLPLLIVIALFVLAAFAGVVWLAYTQGVQRGRADAPREIAALPGPAKVAADNSPDSGTPFKGLKIYSQPAPADEEADQESAPPPSNPMAQAPTQNTPAAAAPKSVRTALPPPAELRPTTVAKTAEAPPTALTKTAPPKAVKVVEAPPVAAEKSAPPPAETKAAPPPAEAAPAATTSGGYVLQIGAYKSEAEANGAWQAYQTKHATLLSGYSSNVKRADLGPKGVWYRLRIGGFADKDVAVALCDRLKADSGACFLGK